MDHKGNDAGGRTRNAEEKKEPGEFRQSTAEIGCNLSERFRWYNVMPSKQVYSVGVEHGHRAPTRIADPKRTSLLPIHKRNPSRKLPR